MKCVGKQRYPPSGACARVVPGSVRRGWTLPSESAVPPRALQLGFIQSEKQYND